MIIAGSISTHRRFQGSAIYTLELHMYMLFVGNDFRERGILPVIYLDPVTITKYKPKGLVQLYRTGVVNFKCVASGTPTPNVEWGIIEEATLDFHSLQEPKEEETELRLELRANKNGRYLCRATNKYEVMYSPSVGVIVYGRS